MTNFWKSKRVLLTGGHGFLGSYVKEKLEGTEAVVVVPEIDLRVQHNVHFVYQRFRPNIVINLAGAVGGIQANLENTGSFLYDNLLIGLNMLDGARHWGTDKFVQIGTVCSYPNVTPLPMKEDDLWNGFPEISNSSYGVAKRVLVTACQAYRKQYGLNAISLIPINLYGPRDHFDPKKSHVIPALIKKCFDAKEANTELNVWGTGEASREFIHAEDCAEGILKAAEFYDKPEPVNLGTGQEITIRSLVLLISHMTGFLGPITWDHTKPDGQWRRCLDVSRAKREFGFEAKIDFTHGLAQTIDWYAQERRCGRLL
jgi:GDP-L-fucose synthase